MQRRRESGCFLIGHLIPRMQSSYHLSFNFNFHRKLNSDLAIWQKPLLNFQPVLPKERNSPEKEFYKYNKADERDSHPLFNKTFATRFM